MRVEVVSVPDGVTRAVLTLPGAGWVRFRLDDGLALCDDLGRVFVLDLENGSLLRDLRL